MPQLAYYRGGKLVKKIHSDMRPEPYNRIPHFKNYPADLTMTPEELLEAFIETFELNQSFHCPVCDCYIYNSTNYLEAPSWLAQIIY